MISVEAIRDTNLRAFLGTVDEEINRQKGWPLTKTEVIDRFSAVITSNPDGDDNLALFLNRLTNTRIISFQKIPGNRRFAIGPDQVMVVAALYLVYQQEPKRSWLSKLVSEAKEALGDHPLADLIRMPLYPSLQKLHQERAGISAPKTKPVEPVETPAKKPTNIPEISEEQIDQARRLDSASLDKLQQKITKQPVLDEISFSRIDINPEQVLMILFIRAVDSQALTYFHPDLVLGEISDIDLRDDLKDGIKRCLRILGDCKKRAEANGKETTINELGELFLRVKRHAE